MQEHVFKIKAEGDLQNALQKSLNAHGDLKKTLTSGDKLLLLPNFNTADEFPGSTDMSFLKEVVGQILNTDVTKIYIGASSTIAMVKKTEDVLEEKGVYELEDADPRVEVVNFDKYEWIQKKIPHGKYLKKASVPELLEETNKMILLPCLKTHCLAQFTGALKLTVGMMKPSERVALHAKNIQEKIAELNLLFNPDLVVMDARKCFIRKGPMKGPTEEPDIIMSSPSRVKIDLAGVEIIKSYKKNSLDKINPEQLSQIKRAVEVGVS